MFKFNGRLSRVSLILLMAVLTLGIVGATVYSKAGEFKEADSLSGLKSASGIVSDLGHTFQPKPPPTPDVERDWVVNGLWTLDCGKECTKAKLGKIKFDMGVSMYDVILPASGNSSHTHTFSGFSADGATIVHVPAVVSPPSPHVDTLVITGEITSSGAIGTDEITIKLTEKPVGSGNFAFSFEMDDGTLSLPPNVLTTEVSGSVIESKGK